MVPPETVPAPVPLSVTVSVNRFNENVAVTLRAWSSVTVHVPLAFVHAPLQPEKFDVVPGLAVSVIIVLYAAVSLQSVGQVMPEPVTVPAPLPLMATMSVKLLTANV